MLSEAELRFLDSRRVAHLATADAAGAPHVVPVCFSAEPAAVFIAIDEKPKRVRPARLKRLAPGTTLRVLATDPASVIDFRHFCETAPFELLGWRERAGTYAFRIRVPG